MYSKYHCTLNFFIYFYEARQAIAALQATFILSLSRTKSTVNPVRYLYFYLLIGTELTCSTVFLGDFENSIENNFNIFQVEKGRFCE
ncbi:hypothetical protein FDUTEX481_01055 [Tolypothrix sp. PCC 7601]|nr:hypothetical protein FDUTEX481_01055 [Tolypothrix sp. PCC 7601]